MVVLFTTIIFSCSKKNNVNPSTNNMEQIFYTQEGSRYILKTVSRNLTFVEAANSNYYPLICINSIDSANGPFYLSMTTDKRIIPVTASFSARSTGAGGSIVDIQSPYYALFRGNTGLTGFSNSTDNIVPLSKSSPIVERVFYTSNNFYNYNFKYSQSVYCNNDFISTQGGISLIFTPSLSFAYSGVAFGLNTISTTPDSYYATVVFTYFELQ